MSEPAFASLGIEQGDVTDFIQSRVYFEHQGEPAFTHIDRLGRDVWGRVLEYRHNYFPGVPWQFQPSGDLSELVTDHMTLVENSGLMIPDYQIVELEGNTAVFTDAITGSSLDTATPEELGNLGSALGRLILGDDAVRPALQSIMPNNFVNGGDSRGRVGIFMVDPDPYILKSGFELTDSTIAAFINKVTGLLCDAVGGDWENVDERRTAMFKFITEFFAEVEHMPKADMLTLMAQGEALLYRDGVNIAEKA